MFIYVRVQSTVTDFRVRVGPITSLLLFSSHTIFVLRFLLVDNQRWTTYTFRLRNWFLPLAVHWPCYCGLVSDNSEQLEWKSFR